MLTPPLAVALFTTILKRNGYEISLFDTTEYQENEDSSSANRVKNLQYRKYNHEKDIGDISKSQMLNDYEEKLVEFSPNVVMYVSIVEDTFLKLVTMMERVRHHNIPSIIGGIFPTSAPEKCLQYDVIDVVSVGEGETTIVDFAECITAGKSIGDVRGIWYKDSSGIVKNKSAPLVDIELTVPDYSLFDQEKFKRPMGGKIFTAFAVETYRGCPYQCTYCNSPGQRDNARQRVQESLILEQESVRIDKDFGKDMITNFLRRKNFDVLENELDEISNKYNPEFIYFIDDAFLARPQKEILKFCEMYKKFNKPFWFNTRPENCTKENLAALKKVGCYRISFGIECGNEDFRKNVLKRKGTNKDILKWFDIIAESGIPFSVNLVVGFPGETREKVFDTIELVRKIRNYDALTVSIFTPYHGTQLRDIAVKNGWLDDSTITVHTTSSSLLKMPSPYLSSKEIDSLFRVLPLYTYFPKADWPEIKKAEQFDTAGNKIFEKYASIYRKEFLGENQDVKYRLSSTGGTGCKVDPKSNYDLITKAMPNEEIALLRI
jgi:anaerobic magnesium-protoporphyrin IX monomethyl ester cyclase